MASQFEGENYKYSESNLTLHKNHSNGEQMLSILPNLL